MTMVVCIVGRLVFMSNSVIVSGFVPMIVVYFVLLNVACFMSLRWVYFLLVCVVGVMDVVLFV